MDSGLGMADSTRMLLWREIDKKRLEYVIEYGILVIGAVVAGQIREMEILEQEGQLYQFQ
ncbi:hypothetical protein [Sediminibacillus halophilus]|nr:hypothetical protein [Sediminibacillus halophilus]